MSLLSVTILSFNISIDATDCDDFRSRDATPLASLMYMTTEQIQPEVTIKPRRIDQLLMTYVLPVIIFAGTFGNMMSAVVLVRPSMRFTSVYFYLLVLAGADTTVLYVSAFKTWIRLLTDYELLHLSNVVCKTVMFVLLVSMYFSAWLVVLTTIDRFLAVWFPLRAAIACSVSKARIATGSLLLVVCLFNVHVFWTMRLQKSESINNSTGEVIEKFYCGLDPSSYFIFNMFEYMKIILYCTVPFMIILCLNIAIICRLRWSAPALRRSLQESSRRASSATFNHRRSMNTPNWMRTSTSDDRGSNQYTASLCSAAGSIRRQARVTSMLLAVSFTWLVLTSPFTVFALVFLNGDNPDPNYLLKAIFFLLMYTNHAVNFYLYCITGKKFRRELVNLIRRMFGRTNTSLPVGSPSVKTLRTSNIGVEAELQELEGNLK